MKTYLQREDREIETDLASFKQSCAISGCTLMTNYWSDRMNRSIVNIVAHRPVGVAFLYSKDASTEKHDGNYIYQFIVDAIKSVRPDNVVQIVMDMAAAKSLPVKRPTIFWTSCAAQFDVR